MHLPLEINKPYNLRNKFRLKELISFLLHHLDKKGLWAIKCIAYLQPFTRSLRTTFKHLNVSSRSIFTLSWTSSNPSCCKRFKGISRIFLRKIYYPQIQIHFISCPEPSQDKKIFIDSCIHVLRQPFTDSVLWKWVNE